MTINKSDDLVVYLEFPFKVLKTKEAIQEVVANLKPDDFTLIRECVNPNNFNAHICFILKNGLGFILVWKFALDSGVDMDHLLGRKLGTAEEMNEQQWFGMKPATEEEVFTARSTLIKYYKEYVSPWDDPDTLFIDLDDPENEELKKMFAGETENDTN